MSSDTDTGSKPWHDAERLKELYYEDGLSTRDIATRFGCSQTTIQYNMEKHGIERRVSGGSWNKSSSFYTTCQGEVFRCNSGEVYIHRLLAVSEFGYEAVKDMGVPHENGLKWDNRPENIELSDPTERTYTDEELLSWIDTFVSGTGVVPSAADLIGWPGPSAGAYADRFGSFPQAVREAGYTPRGDFDE